MASRWAVWAACAVLGVTIPGCLFVRHSTNVVRQDEQRRPVQFESESAKNIFQAGVVKMSDHKEGSNPHVVAIPFLCWYSRVDVPSDNAVYNDQVAACDSNGDGLIATSEAQLFGERVQEQIQLAEAKEKAKQAGANPPSAPTAVQAAGSTPPVR